MPSLSGMLLPGHRKNDGVKFYQAEVSRDANGEILIYAEKGAENSIVTGLINRVIIPTSGPGPDPQLFARFLGKIAIECFAQQFLQVGCALDELIDHEQLDQLRNYSRFGKTELKWPYSERHIYPPDLSFTSTGGEPYEVLHEWTFLWTDKNEMYFVLAILGIEYVINMGGPDLEGYETWLKENNARSPLYLKDPLLDEALKRSRWPSVRS